MLRCAGLWVLAATLASFAQEPPESESVWDRVTLYRDEWGVPHVYASDYRAMAFAFGYAQAEDHLEDMLLAYRAANGRAAEVFGEAWVESDELAIRLGHGRLARAALETADAVTVDLCEGFAEGLNTWMTEHLDEVPEWAEGAHGADALALLHFYLMTHVPYDLPDAYAPMPGMPGANAWAVAPAMSKSGDAMLVMNPQTDYEGMFQWYEAHLVAPDLNVAGATLFGLPALLMGHNEVLGWALSPNDPDVADVYVEQRPRALPRSPTSVMPARGPAPQIAVQFVDSYPYFVMTASGLERRDVPVYAASHGPVILIAAGQVYSLRAGGYGDFGALRQLFDMARAKDLDDFRAALNRQHLPVFHVVYADAAGNIFYQYTAKTGERPKIRPGSRGAGTPGVLNISAGEISWDRPLPTQDGAYEWGPTLLPTALPVVLNPESGYVQASGTVPWLTSEDSGTGPSDWPDWLVRDVDSYRAKRLRHLFEQGPRSVHDMQSMLFDEIAPFAVESVPLLLEAAANNPDYVARAHPDLVLALDLLREWNFLAESSSTAMTYYHLWWSVFRLNDVGEGQAPEELHALMQQDAPGLALRALDAADEAARLMRNEYQSINVPWGSVHSLRRGPRDEAIGGALSGEPLFMMGDRVFEGNRWPATQGPGFAMVVRFSKTPEAVSLSPFGSSEDESSPHYDDQMDLLLERRFKVTRFRREDVERHAVSARGTTVALRSQADDSTFVVRSERPVTVSLTVARQVAASLPAGTVPFTPFVEPVPDDPSVRLLLDMDFHIPGPICETADLGALAVYAYSPLLGWQYIEDQVFDPGLRVFRARVRGPRVCAVIGPRSVYQGAPPETVQGIVPSPRDYVPIRERFGGQTQVAQRAEESESPVLGRPRGTRGAALRDVTPVAHSQDERVLGLSARDAERVRTSLPEAAPVVRSTFDRDSRRRASGLDTRRARAVLPNVPPGWQIPQPGPGPNFAGLTPPSSGSVRGPKTLPGAAEGEESGRAAGGSSKAEKMNDAGAPTPILSNIAPRAAGSAPLQPLPPRANTSLPPTEPVATYDREGEKGRVMWTSKSPEELLAGELSRPKSISFVYDSKNASKVFLGRFVELRSPRGDMSFRVQTLQNVRVQSVVLEVLPEALPEGLAAFTPVVQIVYAPIAARGNVAIYTRVPESAVAREAFGQLKLYVYDDTEGWVALKGQRSNPAERSLTAIDLAVRTYVVLGPETARR